MWGHFVQSVTHWPWSTIAAFASAVAVLWVARAETRERSQALGRQVVVDVNSAGLRWSGEAARFLGLVQGHMAKKVPAAEVNNEGLERLSTATADTDRVFKSARLACNDFELQVRIAEAEMHIGGFLKLIQRRPDSIEHERQRLARIVNVGLTSIEAFNLSTEALIKRGFVVYEQRRSIGYKVAKWRFDRAAKAEAAAKAALPQDSEQSNSNGS